MGMTGLNNDHAYSVDFFFENGSTYTDFEEFAARLATAAGLPTATATTLEAK
jgi:hypothetical protein